MIEAIWSYHNGLTPVILFSFLISTLLILEAVTFGTSYVTPYKKPHGGAEIEEPESEVSRFDFHGESLNQTISYKNSSMFLVYNDPRSEGGSQKRQKKSFFW